MTTPAPAQPVPPPSGPEREDQAQQAGAAVGAAFAVAEAAILAAIAASILAVFAGSLGVAMAKRKIRIAITSALGAAMHKAGPVISALPPSAQAPIRQAVLNAQASAAQSAAKAIAAATGAGSPGPPRIIPPSESPGNVRDISALYRAQMDQAKGSKGGPFRDVPGAHKAAVQAAMAEKMSRLRQAQKVMDDLASQGITGFTGKDGRQWSLSAYAEMATRTAQSRLILQNQLKLMGPAGVTLVIVDNPAMEAACKLCRPFEGRVLALTGQGTGTSTITDASGQQRTEQIAGTLADAVAAGLLHPNCRHSLLPWHDGSGLVATAGGAQRGYVVAGQSAPQSLPIGTPQQYEDGQKLRAHERSVRRAQMKASAALTPQAKRAARVHLAASRAALEAHVAATGATRLPGREKVFRADRKANPGQPYQAR